MKSILQVVARPVLCACLLLLCAQAASARQFPYTFYSNGPDARWEDGARWFPFYPGTTIQSHMSVTINGDCNIGSSVTNRGTLNISGHLKGSVVNEGTLNNYGTLTGDVNNTGRFENQGTFQTAGKASRSTGVLNNHGTLRITYTGLTQFANAPAGMLINLGTLESNTSFENSGTLANYGTLNLTAGTLTNYERVLNRGALNVRGGGLDNRHLFENRGPLTVESGSRMTTTGPYFENYSDGTLNISGSLRIEFNSALANHGSLNNSGELRNYGTLRNHGRLTNSGATVGLENSGPLENTGELSNNGVLTNYATLTNRGAFTNQSAGRLDNKNTLVNDGGVLENLGTLENSAGRTLNIISGTLTNRGSFSNRGSLTTQSASTLHNNGSLTNYSALVSKGKLVLAGNTLINDDGGAVIIGHNSTIEKSHGVLFPAPTFEGTVNLIYSGSSAVVAGPELPTSATALANLQVNNSGGVTLHADATVNGTLILSLGRLWMGDGRALSVAATATISRASGYVVGNLRRHFNGSAAGVNALFPVGTANGYSPVIVNPGAAAGRFDVKATEGRHPQVQSVNALKRYWTLSASGIASADLKFAWLPGDVVGNLSSYNALRYSDGFTAFHTSITPPSFFFTTTLANVNGVTSFSSDWTLAERSSLQSSAASYSDGETDAEHTFTIPVTRTGGVDAPVSVNYAVTNGTATTADNDYSVSSASGTLTWAAYETASRDIVVTVKGDTKYENNETVLLTFSGPSVGAILNRGSATLNVTNDDPAPSFTVDDVTHSEGDNGTTAYVFNVTANLTGSTALDASVNFQTVDGTATAAGGDYQPHSGTLTFTPAETTKTVTVLVNGDITHEDGETFTLRLSGAAHATIADDAGAGDIVNDDSVPPPSTLVVNTPDDLDDGECSASHCSLREAVAAANLCPDANVINFAAGLSGRVSLTDALPALSTKMEIRGPGANVLTVARETGGDYRVFTIAGETTVSISGLAVSNGRALDYGGGISNAGTLTLTAVAVSGNSALVSGGGIHSTGTLTLTGSTLDGNSAHDGGGLDISGTALVINTTVSGNSAANGGGGLLAGGGQLTMANVTVTGNRADADADGAGAGGGLRQIAGAVRLINTISAVNFRGFGDSQAADDVSGHFDGNESLNNLIGVGTGMTGLVHDRNRNQVGTAAAPLNPGLGPLQDNGGPTRTHAHDDDSPAYDGGSTCVTHGSCLSAPLTTDQRGRPRRLCQKVDIGAFEFDAGCS